MKSLLSIFSIVIFHFVSKGQTITFQTNCDLIQENEIIQNIDSLDGLSISMLDEIVGSGPAPFCPAGGSTHNQSWLAFVAKEGDYKIIVSATNCTQVGGFVGMQTAIYTNCEFTENVFCQPNCNSGVTEISSDLLIPGETYYMILDGCAGSTCDITFWVDDYLPLGCITEWQSSVGGFGGFSSFNYFYDGDTIISGFTYRKIITNPNPNFLPTRYIREDNRKVYEYSTINNSENIIYDFTLNVGDELEYSSGFVGIVIKVDTIMLSSGRYTRWELDGPGPSYRYIEGIGGDHLFYADQLGISDPVYSTSCVYKYCDKIMGLDECMSLMNWDTESTMNSIVCEGESIIFDDQVISSEGVYTNVLTNTVGCDSTITLNVSILPTAIEEIQEEICEGESIVVDGTLFDENNPIGTVVFPNGTTTGCDSIVTINLSFMPNVIQNYQSIICEGDFEVWAGDTIFMAGDYTFNLMSVLECDSIINLSMEVIPKIITEFNFESCDGSDIDIEGISYTESGTYEFNFEASTGCDSVVIYNLNFFPIIEESDSVLICFGDTLIINGDVIFSEGIYQTVYSSSKGCDSIISLSVEVMPNIISEFNFEICEGSDIEIESVSFTESGIYEFDFEAANGCDSVVIYDLNFLPLSVVSDTFYICPGDSVIISIPGDPDVIIFEEGAFGFLNTSVNGCDSIYNAQVVLLDSLDTECMTSTFDLLSFDLDISPNPFHQSINLKSEELIQSIEVISISGVKVDIIDQIETREYTYDGSELPAGVFILTVRSRDKIAIKRIVKN